MIFKTFFSVLIWPLFICITAISCTKTVRYLDRVGDPGPIPLVHEMNKCPYQFNSNTETFTSTATNANAFVSIIPNDVKQKGQLTPLEKGVSWILLHLYLRPDVINFSSGLQIYIGTPSTNKYFEFHPKDESNNNLLFALDSILQSHGAKNRLLDLLIRIENNLPNGLPIDRDFSIFLKENSKEIQKNPYWQKVYFKADEVLQEGETIPRPSYRDTIAKIFSSKSQLLATEHRELPFKVSYPNEHQFECNIDLTLHQNGIFPIENELYRNLSITYQSKELTITAFAGLRYQRPLTSKGDSLFFSGKRYDRSLAVCRLKSPDSESFYFSMNTRDPGQILNDFLFNLSKNLDPFSDRTIAQTLEFGRSITLYHPKRKFVETKREHGLLFLNDLDITSNHIDSLGEIWVLKSSYSDGLNKLYIDDRSHFSTNQCPNKR